MWQHALIAVLMAVLLNPPSVRAELGGADHVNLILRARDCGVTYQTLTAAGVELEPQEIIDEIVEDAKALGASASQIWSLPEFFERGRKVAKKAGLVSRSEVSEEDRLETMSSVAHFNADCRSKLIESFL